MLFACKTQFVKILLVIFFLTQFVKKFSHQNFASYSINIVMYVVQRRTAITLLIIRSVLSRRRWSTATTGPPGPFVAIFVAMDGPPGPSMAAIDGLPCCKWSPQDFSLSCTA